MFIYKYCLKYYYRVIRFHVHSFQIRSQEIFQITAFHGSFQNVPDMFWASVRQSHLLCLLEIAKLECINIHV